MSQELLPCPVCGKPAELHKTAEGTDEYPDNGCFVVFCQDTHCAGNCAPERSTSDEAISAWNEQAAHPKCRWYKTCCPNCGWTEADDQGFLEHQRNLPQIPLWKRIFRCIFRWIPFSSLYVFAVVLFLLRFFDEVVQSEGIELGITALIQFQFSVLFATPFLACWVIDMLQTYIRNLELNQYFDNNQTITP